MSNFIPYGRQSIDDNDIHAVVEVLKSDFITQGPKVGQFETALAEYCDTRHAVVFSSGTAALHAAYFAAGIGPGAEVITSPITFAATANAALYMGAKPVFVDIEPDTGNIETALIEGSVTDRTKAIVPVHYAGHPVDMDGVMATAKKHGLVVVEDACHALGAEYKRRKAGSIGAMGVFSFHPVKPITTGEGGAVLTDDEVFYKKLKEFRTHGITKSRESFQGDPHGPWYYEMQHLGFNYRLTDIQAALGTSQLKKLDGFTEKRRQIVAEYRRVFEGNSWFEMVEEKSYARSAWHLFPILLKDGLKEKKAAIALALRERGIGTNVHYIPVYLHPYYRRLGYEPGLCPRAEEFYERELSIPIYFDMDEDSIRRIVEMIGQVMEEVSR